MSTTHIVTCFPLGANHVEQIQAAAGGSFSVTVSGQETIADDILNADIFCGHAKVPVDWEKVVRHGRLKWIQSSAAGLDHCLVPAVIDSDVMVSGCSGLFAPQVGEQMLALLTGLTRRTHVFFRAQQKREFVRRPTDELFGKTVGILGFGGNGQRIAKILRPMVDRIIATDIFQGHCQRFVDNGLIDEILAAEELEALLAQVDVVIVTLPLTAENEGRIGDEQFRLMKPGAYLVNVGRGSVVDTPSLIRSLASGHLGGAGLDVVDPEPLPVDSELWGMDNVIISPHVGAQSAFRIQVTIDLFCDNLGRYGSGKNLQNLVDKQLGFPRPENRLDFDGC